MWCLNSLFGTFVHDLFRSFDYTELSTPNRHCAHPHVSERRGRKRKAQRFKCWPFVPSGQIYIYVARVQSGRNNTFECSAEWATIAVVCKQCGPGSGSGHRTQLPRLQAPALRLWHTWHSHRFNETQQGSKHFISAARYWKKLIFFSPCDIYCNMKTYRNWRK